MSFQVYNSNVSNLISMNELIIKPILFNWNLYSDSTCLLTRFKSKKNSCNYLNN